MGVTLASTFNRIGQHAVCQQSCRYAHCVYDCIGKLTKNATSVPRPFFLLDSRVQLVCWWHTATTCTGCGWAKLVSWAERRLWQVWRHRPLAWHITNSQITLPLAYASHECIQSFAVTLHCSTAPCTLHWVKRYMQIWCPDDESLARREAGAKESFEMFLEFSTAEIIRFIMVLQKVYGEDSFCELKRCRPNM